MNGPVSNVVLPRFVHVSRIQGPDQYQRPQDIGNANDEITLLTTEALIQYLNTLLAMFWLLRDVSDLGLDRLSTHPVEHFFSLLRRIIHDVNTFHQTLRAAVNLRLTNKGIETLSRERSRSLKDPNSYEHGWCEAQGSPNGPRGFVFVGDSHRRLKCHG
jgi:hypothetical protein